MKTSIGRWIVLLLALVCVVQVVSADFDIKTENINPASGALEPGQQVTAHYVLSYSMITDDPSDESFEFSTGLQNPTWDFIVYRDGVAIYKTTKTGYYPTLTEFEIAYKGKIELDVQLRGTVPTSTTGKIEVIKIQHMREKDLKDTYSKIRDVANLDQVQGSLSAQQQNLNNLKADIDDKAVRGIDVSAAQAKYNVANQEFTNAASSSPSQAAGHITTATNAIDEAKSLPDKAWAEKEVANTGATLEDLDGMITYFVESRSMGSDPQVVAIMTKRESAFQFYSQAKDNLNANNYPLARSKAAEGQNKANEALADANALRERIGDGFSLDGSLLLYAGIGVMVAIVLPAGYLLRSKRSKGTREKSARTGGISPPGSPPGHGQAPRHREETRFAGKVPTDLDKADTSGGKAKGSISHVSQREPPGSTAKPEISITLSHTTIRADEWDKIGLTLVNTGTIPAFDITLAFPNDIDTRLIQPINLAAGTSTTLEAGIKPRTKGKVPLEVVIRYRDAGNQTYKQIKSFWLFAESQSDLAPSGSPIPPSISRPMAPWSLPPEMEKRYTASEFIGKGGFARVFKVQKPDGSWAALKIPISLDAATGKSFIAELQNWTSMVHENIVRVNDYNIMPFPYFEMELCDGTLAELEHPIPSDHAAWLLFNICEGLKYAHARGILHRDLKPQNIMLRGGIPKISDWGLSKVMTQPRTTTISGGFTAYYAAPEQISNKPKDERTDIWQLGVILYELVTGRLPFAGESMVEIGMAIATKTPKRPGAVHPDAEPLDAIILRCLEKDPEQRYQSVADLQKDLAAYLKANYSESLKESIRMNNLHRSAYYCGDLVLISMKIGNLRDAYKYAVDIAKYSVGETRVQADELVLQIKMRIEMGAQELPDELIRKAEVIVHQVRVR